MTAISKLGVIGGTGLYDLPELMDAKPEQATTAYGEPSSAIVTGKLAGMDVCFLARHGVNANIPPHIVNYRANITALQQQGVSHIIAVNAVGGITDAMQDGVLCVPHDVIDYTYGRDHTFSDSASVPLQHIEFAHPFDQALRDTIQQVAKMQQIPIVNNGVYGATQGPRLETAAEIQRLAQDGCDIVGMTVMPEAALAREVNMPYASISVVVNRAAGLSDTPITIDDIYRVLEQGITQVKALLVAVATHASTGE